MKDSEVYLRAAEDVDAGADGFWSVLCNHSQSLLTTEARMAHWFSEASWTSPKKVRVLALCFMAAIAESEGR